MSVVNVVLVVLAFVAAVVKNAIKAFGLVFFALSVTTILFWEGLPPFGMIAGSAIISGVIGLVYGVVLVAYRTVRIQIGHNPLAETEKELRKNERLYSDLAVVMVNIPGLSLRDNLFHAAEQAGKEAYAIQRKNIGL